MLKNHRRRVLLALLFASSFHPALPALAQSTLVGYWEPLYFEDSEERIRGPEIGDYTGLPISDAARMRADTWEPDLPTMPERQCIPHPSTYGFRGIGTLRIWETRDPETQELLRIDTLITWQSQHRILWMDGRPSPSNYALHTWQGFSRAHWLGNVLVVDTDHLKAAYVRRNGVPRSDLATMREYFFRHGDLLTHVSIVSDPVYLTEPLVRSDNFKYSLSATTIPYPCRPTIEVVRPEGAVPHYLPGKNPFLNEFAINHHIPVIAARGGAATALPEYANTMTTSPARATH